MGIIKGQNLRLKIGGKYVAFSTACTVHVSKQLEESSTKDNTNDWTDQEIVGKSWDISCDALFSVDDDQTGINGADALDLVLADEKVEVEFVQTSGDKNRVDGAVKYTGEALINDISINASNKQNTSYSLQAQGCGALVKG